MIDANKILEIAADLIAGHALVVMGRNYAYEPSTISDLTFKAAYILVTKDWHGFLVFDTQCITKKITSH